MKLRTNQTTNGASRFLQETNLLSRVSDGWKISYVNILGSRVENSKLKILCKRTTEELRINNVFKKTTETRRATSNTRFHVKTSRQ